MGSTQPPHGNGRNRGLEWNRKRALRFMAGDAKAAPQRISERIREPLAEPVAANFTWSTDFVHDVPNNDCNVRVFNAEDHLSREAVAVRAERSFPTERVVGGV